MVKNALPPIRSAIAQAPNRQEARAAIGDPAPAPPRRQSRERQATRHHDRPGLVDRPERVVAAVELHRPGTGLGHGDGVLLVSSGRDRHRGARVPPPVRSGARPAGHPQRHGDRQQQPSGQGGFHIQNSKFKIDYLILNIQYSIRNPRTRGPRSGSSYDPVGRPVAVLVLGLRGVRQGRLVEEERGSKPRGQKRA